MTRLTAAVLLTALVITAAPALALGPLDVDASVGLHSKYVWRGQIATPDPVLQPSLELGVMGLSVGVWSNVDLTDVNNRKTSLLETDYTVGYALSLPLVSLGAGFIYYDYPTSVANSTSEVYVNAEANVLLSPHAAIYHDVDQVKGTYVSVGGAYDYGLAETVALRLGADLGYGSEGYQTGYFGVAKAGASDLLISASLPWHGLPFVTIEPHVSWATLLGDAKTATKDAGKDTDTVFVGVTASVNF